LKRIRASGWIGVDLDGTLAHYEGYRGAEQIGAPVPAMVARVQQWLAEGIEVRVFTARVYLDIDDRARMAIEDWCWRHIGEVLSVTCQKDSAMRELWDDRAVQVEPNTGRRIGNHEVMPSHTYAKRPQRRALKKYLPHRFR
jgi:hypothetical protein